MSIPVVVYEDFQWKQFLPLTYMRATFQLVCGMSDLLSKVRGIILSASEKSEEEMTSIGPNVPLSVWCRPNLSCLVSEQIGLQVNSPLAGETLLLSGRALWRNIPSVLSGKSSWVGTVGAGGPIGCVFAGEDLWSKLSPTNLLDEDRLGEILKELPRRDIGSDVKLFNWPWEVVLANEEALLGDWSLVQSKASIEGQVDDGSFILGKDSVHIGPGTRIKPGVVIDAEKGPVWIGNNVKVMPHTYIQGPTFIGDNSLIQPGAVVHEGTTIGPVCKVGGEIEASIIHGFSNKQHDGFLGHGYIGSWVNIAADCINSDLKNTYGTIRVPIHGEEVETGEMFVGMLVGDYSKIGINVSLPTGAVIGFCSSVVASLSPKYVPSFAWLSDGKMNRYDKQRGLTVAKKVMARRKQDMSAEGERVFLSIEQEAKTIERQDVFQ